MGSSFGSTNKEVDCPKMSANGSRKTVFKQNKTSGEVEMDLKQQQQPVREFTGMASTIENQQQPMTESRF